mgnify:CR=1 FL=1
MPVERFRSVAEMPAPPKADAETRMQRIGAAWSRAHLHGPPRVPRGVSKFKSIEDAQRARDAHTRARIQRLRRGEP